MIIKTDETQEQFSSDPPPVYTARDDGTELEEEVTESQPPPANFYSLHRSSGRIKASFTVDPLLVIPEQFLTPLERGEIEDTRPNLRLVASHGAIDTDIWIVGDNDESDRHRLEKPPLDYTGKRRKTLLKMSSRNGSVRANIRAPTLPRGPMSIDITATHGNVVLRLPRSYHGPLTMTTRHGAIHLSSELSSSTTTFSDIHGTRTCFIGDLAQWTAGGGTSTGPDGSGWAGDIASVSTRHGSIKVMFVDDRELLGGQARKEMGSLGRDWDSWIEGDGHTGSCRCTIQ